MADLVPRDPFAPDAPTQAETDTTGSREWADYLKTLGAGARQVEATGHALVRKFGEATGDEEGARYARLREEQARAQAEQTTKSMTPKAQRDIESNALLNPAAIPLKIANMAPATVAAMLPMVVIGPALGAVGGTLAAGAVGGVQGLASFYDTIYEKTDSMSNADLAKNVPMYRDMLNAYDGNEDRARAEYNKFLHSKDGRDYMAVLFGVVAGGGGAGGTLTRGLAGRQAAKEAGEAALQGVSRWKAGGKEALSGALTEMPQTGHELQAGMETDVELGRAKTVDGTEWALRTLEAGGLGGLLGGVTGVATHGGQHAAPKPAIPEADQTGRTGHGGLEAAPPAEAALDLTAAPRQDMTGAPVTDATGVTRTDATALDPATATALTGQPIQRTAPKPRPTAKAKRDAKIAETAAQAGITPEVTQTENVVVPPPGTDGGVPDAVTGASEPIKTVGTGADAPPPGSASTADATKTKRRTGKKAAPVVEETPVVGADEAQTAALDAAEDKSLMTTLVEPQGATPEVTTPQAAEPIVQEPPAQEPPLAEPGQAATPVEPPPTAPQPSEVGAPPLDEPPVGPAAEARSEERSGFPEPPPAAPEPEPDIAPAQEIAPATAGTETEASADWMARRAAEDEATAAQLDVEDAAAAANAQRGIKGKVDVEAQTPEGLKRFKNWVKNADENSHPILQEAKALGTVGRGLAQSAKGKRITSEINRLERAFAQAVAEGTATPPVKVGGRTSTVTPEVAKARSAAYQAKKARKAMQDKQGPQAKVKEVVEPPPPPKDPKNPTPEEKAAWTKYRDYLNKETTRIDKSSLGSVGMDTSDVHATPHEDEAGIKENRTEHESTDAVTAYDEGETEKSLKLAKAAEQAAKNAAEAKLNARIEELTKEVGLSGAARAKLEEVAKSGGAQGVVAKRRLRADEVRKQRHVENVLRADKAKKLTEERSRQEQAQTGDVAKIEKVLVEKQTAREQAEAARTEAAVAARTKVAQVETGTGAKGPAVVQVAKRKAISAEAKKQAEARAAAARKPAEEAAAKAKADKEAADKAEAIRKADQEAERLQRIAAEVARLKPASEASDAAHERARRATERAEALHEEGKKIPQRVTPADTDFETGKRVEVDAYHGTPTVFERVKNAFKGSNFVSSFNAHWFTASSEAANSYAVKLSQTGKDWATQKPVRPEGSPNVHLAKVTFNNPLVVDMKGAAYDPLVWSRHLKAAEKAGHDGVILKNAVDGAGVKTTVYAALDEKQVRGRFDPTPEVKDTVREGRVRRKADEVEIEHLPDLTPEEEAEFERMMAALADSDEPDPHLLTTREDFDAAARSTEHGRVTDLKTLLKEGRKRAVEEAAGKGESKPARIIDEISKAIHKLAGDVRVYIIDQELLERAPHIAKGIANGKYPDASHVGGWYSYEHDAIILNADYVASEAHGKIHELVAHEGLHAAIAQIIDGIPTLKKDIEALYKDAKRNYDEMVRRGLVADADHYGFKDAHEFLSEAVSNPEFQQLLRDIPVRSYYGKYAWGTAWNQLVSTIQKGFSKFGLPLRRSALEHALKAATDAMDFAQHHGRLPPWHPLHPDYSTYMANAGKPSPETRAWTNDRVTSEVQREFVDAAKGKIKSAIHDVDTPGKLAMLDKVANYFQTFAGLGQKAVKLGFGELGKRIAEANERMHTWKQNFLQQKGGVHEVVRELHAASRKYAGPVWENFVDTAIRATTHNLHPDVPLTDAKNTHVTKTKKNAQARAQHAELHDQFKALPQELKDLWHKTSNLMKDQENAILEQRVNDHIEMLMGKADKALAKKIHEGTLTEEEAANLRITKGMEALINTPEFQKIEGAYLPLMRRGDYVLVGEHTLTKPPKAFNISALRGKKQYRVTTSFDETGGKARFTVKQEKGATPATHRAAEEYAGKQDGPKQYQTLTYASDADGTRNANGDYVTSEVAFHMDHVEHFDSLADAQARGRELEAGGMKTRSIDARREGQFDNNDMMSANLRSMLKSMEQTAAWKAKSDRQKATIRQSLIDQSLRYASQNRASKRFMHRKGISGSSTDIARNVLDYGNANATWLAGAKYRPEIEDGLRAMDQVIAKDPYSKLTLQRRQLLNEMNSRMRASNDGEPQSTMFSPFVNRALQLSFLDKLVSPAFHGINSLQPSMVTLPVLVGRHGVKAASQLRRAYKELGGLSVVKRGLTETGKAWSSDDPAFNYLGSFQDRVSDAGAKAMFQELADVNLLSPDAGMEISKLVDPSGNLVGRGLDRADHMARQMGQAIEALNRGVAALSAYRLEMEKTGNHDAAVAYAKQVVNDTQGNYSRSNAPPIFNNRFGRAMLQFKKYPQMMYQLLGKQLGAAIKGDKEAMKTLAGLAATHVAMAGALGLPTEPLRLMLLAAGAAGFTGTRWEDVEQKAREIGADILGPVGSEAFLRGLPRLLGIDLSSRVGMDNMLTYGEPPKRDANSAKAWLFDTLKGAPAGLAFDWAKGSGALVNGDFAKAAELFLPLKVLSDAAKAYQGYSGGKKTAAGKEVMAPYSPYEAGVRLFGLTPAREAEAGAAASAAYAATGAAKSDRQSMIKKFVENKATVGDVARWNAGKPIAEQIKLSSLQKSKKDAKREQMFGQTVQPYNKRILEQVGTIYNTR